MARLPDPRENFDAEAQAIYDKLAGPRGGLSGMYLTLMHHPALADHVAHLGTYFRYIGLLQAANGLGDVRELGILATARGIGAPFVWEKHIPPAKKAGLPEDVIEQVVQGDIATTEMKPLYLWVWQVARHVVAQENIPQKLQQLLIDEIGLKQTIELVAVCGFYRFIATIVFCFDVPLPDDGPPPF